VFKIADDNGLLLLDLKDLRAMLQHTWATTPSPVHHRIRQHQRRQRRRHPARPAADRSQGGDKFFGEPMLNIDDFMQTVAARGWSTSWRPTS
jgi:hypothetical protein